MGDYLYLCYGAKNSARNLVELFPLAFVLISPAVHSPPWPGAVNLRCSALLKIANNRYYMSRGNHAQISELPFYMSKM